MNRSLHRRIGVALAAIALSLTLAAAALGAEPHGAFVGSTSQGPIGGKPSLRIRASHGEIRKIYLAYAMDCRGDVVSFQTSKFLILPAEIFPDRSFGTYGRQTRVTADGRKHSAEYRLEGRFNSAGTRVTGTVRAIGSATGAGLPESGCALLRGPVTFSVKAS
jgi:hypothetical protein